VRSLVLLLCAALLSPCTSAFAQGPPPQGAPATQSRAEISFEGLKGLAGQWTGTVKTNPTSPDLDGPIQVTMRVASRGSLLVHEIAPGGVPEPTMIYVDGDHLTLVHYCEAGNRPRLIARGDTNLKTVDFVFDDISGSKSPLYLRRFVFRLVDPDHHTEDWTFALADGKTLLAHFDLKRTADSAPRPAGN
jgi:hypothetical protein